MNLTYSSLNFNYEYSTPLILSVPPTLQPLYLIIIILGRFYDKIYRH